MDAQVSPPSASASKTARPGGVREMIAVALPMVVSFACDTVMILTDRVLLSRLGPELMNAALAGGLTVFMMMTFFVGLTGYTTVLTAQYLGAGRKERGPVVVTQAVIVIAAAYPVILLALRPLGHWIFGVSGADPAQIAPQRAYFDLLLAGCFFMMLRHVLSSFFSGIGKTKIVMLASLAAVCVNLGVSYTLIYGKFGLPALGIRGAAAGTVFASVFAAVILAAAYFGRPIRESCGVMKSFVFDGEAMKRLLRFGSPSGLEMMLNILAYNCMIMIFHSMGPAVATASSIVLNWDMVSYVPLMGVEIGVMSLVGRYMGAKLPDVAHRAVRSGLKLGFVFSGSLLFLFVFFPAAMIALFRPDHPDAVFAAAQPTAMFMLRLTAFYLASQVIVIVFTGALRGAGDTLWAMGYTVLLHWVICAALFLTVKTFGHPATTGWIVLIVMFMLLSSLVWLRYRAGHWKTLQVVES